MRDQKHELTDFKNEPGRSETKSFRREGISSSPYNSEKPKDNMNTYELPIQNENKYELKEFERKSPSNNDKLPSQDISEINQLKKDIENLKTELQNLTERYLEDKRIHEDEIKKYSNKLDMMDNKNSKEDKMEIERLTKILNDEEKKRIQIESEFNNLKNELLNKEGNFNNEKNQIEEEFINLKNQNEIIETFIDEFLQGMCDLLKVNSIPDSNISEKCIRLKELFTSLYNEKIQIEEEHKKLNDMNKFIEENKDVEPNIIEEDNK